MTNSEIQRVALAGESEDPGPLYPHMSIWLCG